MKVERCTRYSWTDICRALTRLEQKHNRFDSVCKEQPQLVCWNVNEILVWSIKWPFYFICCPGRNLCFMVGHEILLASVAVWYPWHSACCLIPVAQCLLSDTRGTVPVVWYPWHSVCCLIPVAQCLLSDTRGTVPAVWYPWHSACCLIPVTRYLLSSSTCSANAFQEATKVVQIISRCQYWGQSCEEWNFLELLFCPSPPRLWTCGITWMLLNQMKSGNNMALFMQEKYTSYRS